MVIFAVLSVFWLFLTVLDCFWRLVHRWYTVDTVLVYLWRLVHQWWFLLFWLSFDCFWRLVHRWYTIGTVLVDLWRLVHQWFWVFLTIGTVYHSSKTLKNSQKTVKPQKNDHWCTVYQSSHVYTESAEYTKPRKRRYLAKLHHMCLGSGHSPSNLGRADCMSLHERLCIWLPFAAACCYTLFCLLMMPTARLICQRPSSNFPYFQTPLANFLLSRPNSVEYGNSKTTTLPPSAKRTRPLFQGRTGCGGRPRPSGWHDIVTCQHQVCLTCIDAYKPLRIP